jgi:cell division septation protein DedD
VERVQALHDEIDEQGFVNDSGTRFGEPVLLPADGDTAVWAVQAASFASLDNARAFREDLREEGFEAFISTVRGDDGAGSPMYRVAVGPLLSMADAEQMQANIGARFELQPTVMEMTQ